MNRLESRIHEAIQASGPMPLDRFMNIALTDSQDGYYTAGEGIGARGDFITAPEISQMFGELIGLWMADMWRRMGLPDNVSIVELGPGKGTLMADALRALRRAAPDLLQTGRLLLVEASPALQQMQRERLSDFAPEHIDDLTALGEGPILLVANEFLDALPVRQLVWRADGWRERAVASTDDGLTFIEIDPVGEIPGGLPPLTDGEIVEVSTPRAFVADAVSHHIAEKGGAALFIDYGHGVTAPGDTLQAMKAHAAHPVLADPGEADLTAHVDFAAVANLALDAGTAVYGPIGQRQFLLRLGIEARLAQLMKGAAPEAANGLAAGFRRLTDPAHMGHLFKALCIAHADLGVPTGYVADETFRPQS